MTEIRKISLLRIWLCIIFPFTIVLRLWSFGNNRAVNAGVYVSDSNFTFVWFFSVIFLIVFISIVVTLSRKLKVGWGETVFYSFLSLLPLLIFWPFIDLFQKSTGKIRELKQQRSPVMKMDSGKKEELGNSVDSQIATDGKLCSINIFVSADLKSNSKMSISKVMITSKPSKPLFQSALFLLGNYYMQLIAEDGLESPIYKMVDLSTKAIKKGEMEYDDGVAMNIDLVPYLDNYDFHLELIQGVGADGGPTDYDFKVHKPSSKFYFALAFYGLWKYMLQLYPNSKEKIVDGLILLSEGFLDLVAPSNKGQK